MPSSDMSDAEIWRRSRLTDVVADEAERYLDLAGFVDGLLDEEEGDRVAERLAADPIAAADAAAARMLSQSEPIPAASAPVIARACALLGGRESHNVIPFRRRYRGTATLRRMTGWSGLVAAMAVASWLGFTLGVDTSLSLAQVGQAGDDGFLHELLDPSTGLMRELDEGNRT